MEDRPSPLDDTFNSEFFLEDENTRLAWAMQNLLYDVPKDQVLLPPTPQPDTDIKTAGQSTEFEMDIDIGGYAAAPPVSRLSAFKYNSPDDNDYCSSPSPDTPLEHSGLIVTEENTPPEQIHQATAYARASAPVYLSHSNSRSNREPYTLPSEYARLNHEFAAARQQNARRIEEDLELDKDAHFEYVGIKQCDPSSVSNLNPREYTPGPTHTAKDLARTRSQELEEDSATRLASDTSAPVMPTPSPAPRLSAKPSPSITTTSPSQALAHTSQRVSASPSETHRSELPARLANTTAPVQPSQSRQPQTTRPQWDNPKSMNIGALSITSPAPNTPALLRPVLRFDPVLYAWQMAQAGAQAIAQHNTIEAQEQAYLTQLQQEVLAAQARVQAQIDAIRSQQRAFVHANWHMLSSDDRA